MSDGAQSAIVRMPDGTVKQVGPLTGTRVWTVPGRAHRPLAAPRDDPRRLAPGEERRLCAFCTDRYLETTPEKARLVGPDFRELRRVPADEVDDTVAEFRRFGNLFEIVSAEYWRENHGFRQPASIIEWARACSNYIYYYDYPIRNICHAFYDELFFITTQKGKTGAVLCFIFYILRTGKYCSALIGAWSGRTLWIQ